MMAMWLLIIVPLLVFVLVDRFYREGRIGRKVYLPLAWVFGGVSVVVVAGVIFCVIYAAIYYSNLPADHPYMRSSQKQ